MTTGEKIAALRREKGLSQEALADALSISRQAVSKWEADGAAPSRDKLIELAAYFAVSVDELLRPDEALAKEAAEPPSEPPAPAKARPQLGLLIWCGALTAALAAAIVWNAWLTGQLGELRAQVSGLPGTQTIVTQPAEPAQPSELTSYEISPAYDPETDTVTLAVRVLPREHQDGETALLSLIGNQEEHSTEAVWENGAYTGTVSAPLTNDLSLYLVVTRDGLTRTVEIERLYDLAREYKMEVTANLVKMTVSGNRRTGLMQIACSPSYDRNDGMTNWMTRASVGVYEDDVLVAQSEAGDPAEVLHMPSDEDTSSGAGESALASERAPSSERFETFYVYAEIDAVLAGEDAYALVTYEDNRRREGTLRVNLP